MALNEEKILANRFVFISYSHKDGDAVREDMEALIARGVRVWYDEHMRLGERWTEIAERTIRHENCIGVIFYNSANSFLSNAVQKEQVLARDRLNEEDFRIWSVHMNGKQTPDICMEALASAGDTMRAYFNGPMELQKKLFNDEYLCILRKDSPTTVERIYSEIAEPYHVVDNEDNFMEDALKSKRSSRDTDELALGRYMSAEYYGPEQPSDQTDQRFGAHKTLIQFKGKRYNTKILHWRLMYVKDGRAALLCTRILDQKTFEDGRELLASSFCRVAFDESDGVHDFKGITARYLTAADVEGMRDANTLEALTLAERGERVHWWIDEDGITEYWKQTYSDDFLYRKGFSIFIKKGIRPVIEVPATLFQSK